MQTLFLFKVLKLFFFDCFNWTASDCAFYSFFIIRSNFCRTYFTFIVESKNEIDVRKPIFFMLAQRSWPILSMEFTGANLEDIFISVVDEAEEATAKKV